MTLTGPQQKKLREALLHVCPTRSELELMLTDELNVSLSTITGDINLGHTVFELIRWAMARGRLEELVAAAIKMSGENSELASVAQELGVSTQKVSNSAATKGNSPSPGNAGGSASTKAPSASPRNASGSVSNKKTSGPFEVFISYSHQDKVYRNELNKHLSNLKNQNLIAAWFDGDIVPGTEWRTQILQHLESAQIILLLISADFMDSEFCYSIELKRAIERHKANEARVIPIILRATDWEGAPFADLLILPEDAKPISSLPSRDDAYASVVRGIRRVIKDLQNSI
ncbi:MAG: toll/interleukin-1 receptor domain-containing protein [Chloroflexi bacterium]|nr:MAG: toll/interleukin-1 receptor domain-containing protein [Chloroflexota bacterium]